MRGLGFVLFCFGGDVCVCVSFLRYPFIFLCLKSHNGFRRSLDMIMYRLFGFSKSDQAVFARSFLFPEYWHITFYLICQFCKWIYHLLNINFCILVKGFYFHLDESAHRAVPLIVCEGSWSDSDGHLNCIASNCSAQAPSCSWFCLVPDCHAYATWNCVVLTVRFPVKAFGVMGSSRHVRWAWHILG